MVSANDSSLARMNKGGKHFEVMVDPKAAMRFRKGECGIGDALAAREIFTDSRKGERPSAGDLEAAFHTSDVLAIAAEILKHGELQLTTEQRRAMAEGRKKEIADIISRQGIDPRTKLPHPPQRILNAMDEANVNIDPFRPANEQVKGVLEKINAILPISLESMEISVRIPISLAGKASSVLRSMTSVKREDWGADSWSAVIEIPAGLQAEIYDKLNHATGGRVDIKILKENKI